MRLVAVSNRVESPRNAPAAGGLAVALVEALRDHHGLWLGWSGRAVRHPAPAPKLEAVDGYTLATIDLPRDDFELFYNGFANHCLWPLLHFRIDISEFVRAEYEGYERVNARFAEALTPLLQADDLIWIHDYHLFGLPAELRRRGVRQRVGFFLHTPFPPREILVTLPCHAQLARSLFACDLLGLQTADDVERFVAYVQREFEGEWRGGVLRAFGRSLRVEAFPVGIDARHMQALATSAGAEREFERMLTLLRGRAQIIGVDRLDYSKGLLRRIHAFELLLEQHPEVHGTIDYLQIAPISRGEVTAYRDFRRELEQRAGRINGRFSQVDWTPVRYLNRALPRRTLAGFYRASRIGLVTPMRDGMNLVAKEYVAAQDPADPGVLVLSTFAGAAQQMQAALLVNPYDAGEVADALYRARGMGLDERRERHAALLQGVLAEDTTAWQQRYLAALRGAPAKSRASVAA
jgi:trehalose 6-phosphate synthase